MTEKKRGFFGRLREQLTKTRTNLSDSVRRVFTGRTRLDDETWDELEQILIEADFGVETALGIIEDLRRRAREERMEGPDALFEALRGELVQVFATSDAEPIAWQAEGGPHVTLVIGVNGTGKTTTIGKLAAHLKAQGKTVLLAAGDTFRAAAVDQLTIWADRTGVGLIKNKEGSDPAAVAYDATDAAVARGADCVLIDTAGRLHNKANLMEELRKIHRVVGKRMPGAPHEVLLVLDATTGQNALQQAKVFTEALNVSGLILTKLDGTAKGGIAIAIQKQLGIPIRMIGVGEAVDDLQPFDPKAFVDALLPGEPASV